MIQILAFLLVGAIVPSLGQNRITILVSQKRQTVEGFGLNFTAANFRDDQKKMFDRFIDDLGVTRFRVVPYIVASDWEDVNDNADPDVMNWDYYNRVYSSETFQTAWKAIRYLNSRNIRPTIALMGPVPHWMLADQAPPPRHQVCQPSSTLPPLAPAMYPEFAEEVVSLAMYARFHEHLDFEYFSPINETDCYPGEGPRIDPDQASAVLLAVARRMQKEGLGDVRLSVAEQAHLTNDYVSHILADSELMKSVGSFAFHNYEEDSLNPQIELVRSSPYPSLPTWLTEYGDLHDEDKSPASEWKNFSLTVNRRALIALNEGATAIFYFNAFDDFEECLRRNTFYGLMRLSGSDYVPKKRYFATRQLYHFVPPGSERVEVTGQSDHLTVSAFTNRQSGSLIIVGVKEGGSNRIELALPKGEPSPRSFDLYVTTPSLDCQRIRKVSVKNAIASVKLPDQAVFTLVGHMEPGAR